jgi:hypothetical protein
MRSRSLWRNGFFVWAIASLAITSGCGEPSGPKRDCPDAGFAAATEDAAAPALAVTLDFPGTIVSGRLVGGAGASAPCDVSGESRYWVGPAPAYAWLPVGCSGEFVVFVPAGAHALSVSYADTWPMSIYWTFDVELPSAGAAARELRLDDIVLPRWVHLRGTVMGAPAVPATLAASACGTVSLQAQPASNVSFGWKNAAVDCSGRFEVDVPPGTYEVSAFGSKSVVVLKADAELAVSAATPLALFTGTVTRDGPANEVDCTTTASHEWIELEAEDDSLPPVTLPVCRGAFHSMVPARRYTRTFVMRDGGNSRARVDGPLDLTTSMERDYQMHPSYLRGHVVDVVGQPVRSNMYLSLYSDSGAYVRFSTDQDGHFDVPTLSPGERWAVYINNPAVFLGWVVDQPGSDDVTVNTHLVPITVTLASQPGTEADCRRCLRIDNSPIENACFDGTCTLTTWAPEGALTSFRGDEPDAPPLGEVIPRAPRAEAILKVAGAPIGAAPAPPATRLLRLAPPLVAGHPLKTVFPSGWTYSVFVSSERYANFLRPQLVGWSEDEVVSVSDELVTVTVVVSSLTATNGPSQAFHLGPITIAP